MKEGVSGESRKDRDKRRVYIRSVEIEGRLKGAMREVEEVRSKIKDEVGGIRNVERKRKLGRNQVTRRETGEEKKSVKEERENKLLCEIVKNEK